MSAMRKRVVRFDLWQDPSFAERLAREGDIDLTVAARQGPEQDAWAALGQAHVYQVTSAKDELPRRCFRRLLCLRHHARPAGRADQARE